MLVIFGGIYYHKPSIKKVVVTKKQNLRRQMAEWRKL